MKRPLAAILVLVVLACVALWRVGPPPDTDVERGVARVRGAVTRRVQLEEERAPSFDVPFRARIVRAENGEPVRNVRFMVWGTSFQERRVQPWRAGDCFEWQRTDAHGAIHIAVPVSGDGHLAIEEPGYSEVLARITAGHETEATAKVIELRRSAELFVDVASLASTDMFLEAQTDPGHVDQSDLGSEVYERGGTASMEVGARRLCRLEVPSAAPLDVTLSDGTGIVWRLEEPLILRPGEVRSLIARRQWGDRLFFR